MFCIISNRSLIPQATLSVVSDTTCTDAYSNLGSLGNAAVICTENNNVNICSVSILSVSMVNLLVDISK